VSSVGHYADHDFTAHAHDSWTPRSGFVQPLLLSPKFGAFEVTEAARSGLEIPEIDFDDRSRSSKLGADHDWCCCANVILPKLLRVIHRKHSHSNPALEWIKASSRHAPPPERIAHGEAEKHLGK
jgi:hypothetical protein